MMKQLLTPDYIFESSWEVCNKVGGIYTVLSTRAKTLQNTSLIEFFFIGPDFWSGKENPLFVEDSKLLQAWREHDALLSEKCEILNKYQFTELHYENEAGTDFRVGLVKNHIWEGGSEESGSGVRFIANMPTEEVFTMPDCRKAEGKVVSSGR